MVHSPRCESQAELRCAISVAHMHKREQLHCAEDFNSKPPSLVSVPMGCKQISGLGIGCINPTIRRPRLRPPPPSTPVSMSTTGTSTSTNHQHQHQHQHKPPASPTPLNSTNHQHHSTAPLSKRAPPVVQRTAASDHHHQTGPEVAGRVHPTPVHNRKLWALQLHGTMS